MSNEEWVEVKKKKQRFHALNQISHERALELEKRYRIRNLSATLVSQEVKDLLETGYVFYTAFRDTPEENEKFSKKCKIPQDKLVTIKVDNEWKDVAIFVPNV